MDITCPKCSSVVIQTEGDWPCSVCGYKWREFLLFTSKSSTSELGNINYPIQPVSQENVYGHYLMCCEVGFDTVSTPVQIPSDEGYTIPAIYPSEFEPGRVLPYWLGVGGKLVSAGWEGIYWSEQYQRWMAIAFFNRELYGLYGYFPGVVKGMLGSPLTLLVLIGLYQFLMGGSVYVNQE